jgi:hypothetical protein
MEEQLDYACKNGDPIQQLFSQQPELVELFVKHRDRRTTDTWSGEIDKTGTFSFIITYSCSSIWKVTLKIYFKYLPVINANSLRTVCDLNEHAYKISESESESIYDGNIYVYDHEESKDDDKYNGYNMLKTEEELLHSERVGRRVRILSWDLFQNMFQRIRDERAEIVSQPESVTDMFNNGSVTYKVKRLVNMFFGYRYPSHNDIDIFSCRTYPNESNVEVVTDKCEPPFNCLIRYKVHHYVVRDLCLQFVDKLDSDTYEEIVRELGHFVGKDRYVVVYRELLVDQDKLEQLRYWMCFFTEDEFKKL